MIRATTEISMDGTWLALGGAAAMAGLGLAMNSAPIRRIRKNRGGLNHAGDDGYHPSSSEPGAEMEVFRILSPQIPSLVWDSGELYTIPAESDDHLMHKPHGYLSVMSRGPSHKWQRSVSLGLPGSKRRTKEVTPRIAKNATPEKVAEIALRAVREHAPALLTVPLDPAIRDDPQWASALIVMQGASQRGSQYRSEDELFVVQSRGGKTYNVRLVPPGGSYGRDHALTNEGPAMIEFYWPSDTIGTPPWGNFTGERYRLTTLIKSQDGRPKGLGLQNDRDGQFDAATMNRVFVWALGGDPDSYYG